MADTKVSYDVEIAKIDAERTALSQEQAQLRTLHDAIGARLLSMDDRISRLYRASSELQSAPDLPVVPADVTDIVAAMIADDQSLAADVRR